MIEKFWEYLIVILSIGWIMEGCEAKELESPVSATLPVKTIKYKATDRNALVRAFMHVESANKDKAIHPKTKATGALQIMPVMVREANRLAGYDRFTLLDRLNRGKSVEMFHIVMSKKNPDYNISKACEIWNPRGGDEYRRKIEMTYLKIMEE